MRFVRGGLMAGSGLLAVASGLVAQAQPSTPRLGGYVQARETWTSGVGLVGTINRARVIADGAVGGGFSYKVSAELASGGSATTQVAVSLRDAYVRWAGAGVAVSAGQFKTPFSREFLTPVTAVETADIAAVVDGLSPKRDIGVMADYDWHGRATAALGVFNGEGQNSGVNRDSSVLVVGRATLRPLDPVTLGADVARYRDSTRYGLEVGLEDAGFALKGEYIRQHRLAVGRDDAGWFVLGTWRPRRWLQVVARQEDFQRPAVAAFVRNTATTIGANVWFAGERVRLLADYVSRKVGTRSGALITQAQVVF